MSLEHHEPTWIEVQRLLGQIVNFVTKHEATVVPHVHGMGGETRSTYARITGIGGLELQWASSVLPKPIRWLHPILPSFAGLVKVNVPRRLIDAVDLLGESTLVGVYVFEKRFEPTFLEAVSRDAALDTIERILCESPWTVILRIDMNAPSSSTDILALHHFGQKFQTDAIS